MTSLSKTLCAVLACTNCIYTQAQHLESIGKTKPVTLNGGVSLNQVFYSGSNASTQRQPYSYFSSGNLNASIYGWSIPVSFSISNQNQNFQQPFNRFYLNPNYKWINAQVGFASVSYSPYTLNGHIFLGGSLELSPEGKWKFSTMYGRLLKACQGDTSKAILPQYKRMAYAFKASFHQNNTLVDLVIFHAKDDPSSLLPLNDSLQVTPQENLAVHIGVSKELIKGFIIKAEGATSGLSPNTHNEEQASNFLLGKTFLFRSRSSSSFYNAFKASATYQFEIMVLGIAFEKIDPQYRTLGGYYFNNDLQSITVNATTAIFHGKMNIAASAGTQKDNLDKSKISTMNRNIASLNISYNVSEQLSFTSSYSNFQTFTNIKSQFQHINHVTPYENLDTLNYTQLSQNASFNTMYSFGQKGRKQNLNIMLSIQEAVDKQGDIMQNSGMTFLNFNTSYSINIASKNLVTSVSLNGTTNQGGMVSTKTFGPTLAINSTLLNKKLRLGCSSSFNKTYSNSVATNQLIILRSSAGVSIKKKHSINMTAIVLKRSSIKNDAVDFTATVSYTYGFNLK